MTRPLDTLAEAIKAVPQICAHCKKTYLRGSGQDYWEHCDAYSGRHTWSPDITGIARACLRVIGEGKVVTREQLILITSQVDAIFRAFREAGE